MSNAKRLLGDKIRYGVLAWVLLAGLFGKFTHLAAQNWAVGVYVGVIFVGLLIGSGVDVYRGVGWPRIGGPEDLDRKGGPYDRLHRR